MRTQKNVIGMRVQSDSWKTLDTQLPCSSCVAGKMRKLNASKAASYSDLKTLTTIILASQNPARHFGFAVSRTPATTAQSNERNKVVSVDWAIINKENLPDVFNVFALFYDVNIGLVHVEFQPTRGQAGEALEGYIQRWGIPQTIHHDNAKEFLFGKFASVCRENKIIQTQSAPYSPNQNPAERYMEIIVSGARSLLYTSGLPVSIFWPHAISHRVYIQNNLALPGRCSPHELTTGKQPNLTCLRTFGCETMAYVEKPKRTKFEPKTERCIYLGPSPSHSHDTCKLWQLSTGRIIIRRNVAFNERIYPGHNMKITPGTTSRTDDGADLVGLDFLDEGTRYTITGTSDDDGDLSLTYIDPLKPLKNGVQHESTVREVRKWYNKTQLTQAVNSIVPSRSSFVNDLAYEAYKQIKIYDVQLSNPLKQKAPTSYKQAGNRETQWFSAEDKEKDGIIDFTTWRRLNQSTVTPEMRRKALRAHHLYNIKREGSAKNRVVANGSRQHPDTYSDTTSPVSSQLMLRLLLVFIAYRNYYTVQMDLTNAYLHAAIKDVVFIVIPEGFPGADEIALLEKGLYGTKQGSRRFYDHTDEVFKSIGLKPCPSEPCLYRYLDENGACFILLYVDDALITGNKTTVQTVESNIAKHFKCKFNPPQDFLGLDITTNIPGTTTISMTTFTTKMLNAMSVTPWPYPVITPGRTDIKIIRGENLESNDTYRSKVGSLNWLTMGLRMDLVFTTKELSRVLTEPTKEANQILARTLQYVEQTKHARLEFQRDTMLHYQPPKTRKKPNDLVNPYESHTYCLTDGIPNDDEIPI